MLKPFPTLSLSLSLSSEQASAIGDLYDIADGTVDGLIHAQARSITTDDIRKTLGGSPLLWNDVFVDGIAKVATKQLPEETSETELGSIALASVAVLPWTPEIVGGGISLPAAGTVATGAAIGTGLLGIAAPAALPQSMNPSYNVIQWDEGRVQDLIRQHRPDLYYGQGGSGAVAIGPMPGTASDDFAGPMGRVEGIEMSRRYEDTPVPTPKLEGEASPPPEPDKWDQLKKNAPPENRSRQAYIDRCIVIRDALNVVARHPNHQSAADQVFIVQARSTLDSLYGRLQQKGGMVKGGIENLEGLVSARFPSFFASQASSRPGEHTLLTQDGLPTAYKVFVGGGKIRLK